MPKDSKAKVVGDAPLTIQELERVLTRFTVLSSKSVQTKAQANSRLVPEESREGEFESILTGYKRAIAGWMERQASSADDFNILEILQVTGKEVRHSMMLEWLLDHDLLGHGTHAQGALGFELFLEAAGLPKSYAKHQYWVRREVAGDESRVDLEIAARGYFLIHIENKIWSGEGEAQTSREWSDLVRRGRELGALAVHGLYLTPDGHAAQHSRFSPMSWAVIVTVLRRFAERAQAPDVRLFSAHYARALELFIVRTLEEESADGNAVI